MIACSDRSPERLQHVTTHAELMEVLKGAEGVQRLDV